MRCVCCDASDVGLSYMNHDKPLAKHFHETSDGFFCSDCYMSGEDVLDEWNFEQTMEEEEESAYDYDNMA